MLQRPEKQKKTMHMITGTHRGPGPMSIMAWGKTIQRISKAPRYEQLTVNYYRQKDTKHEKSIHYFSQQDTIDTIHNAVHKDPMAFPYKAADIGTHSI
jgi:hypothetical protein